MPRTVILVFALILILGIGMLLFTISECGLGRTMFLGNGGYYAAQSGMC
jgi:hypothetical protein